MPKLSKCPRFETVPGTGGREEQCKISRDGLPFRVVRYRKTGRLVAWLQPMGPVSYKGQELPVSTPPTRSITELMRHAVKFVRQVRYRYN